MKRLIAWLFRWSSPVTSPPTKLGERSDEAFSLRPGEGDVKLGRNADLDVVTCTAPSPEQRLKGVLDLSPNFVGGEVAGKCESTRRSQLRVVSIQSVHSVATTCFASCRLGTTTLWPKLLTLALTASTLSLAHGQSAVELLPGFDAERLSKIELSDSNTDQPIPIAELSAEDRSELAKLVYRMNRLTGKSLEPLLNSNGGTGTATSLEQRNVGDAFRLKGELLSSTLVPVPGDLAEMLELTAFSRSQVRLSDQSVVDVVSIALPKPAAPADRLSGIAVKIGHGDPVACVAGRLAWSPASPGTPRDAVLAAAGIDLSRLPEIASLERKPLGKNDSDVFFSLIGIAHKAASASDENSRAMRATPIAVQPVDLLKEPKELTAQWVTLQVETVRWTKVAVTSGIRQKQLGGEFYYQIDAIGDLGNVQLRIELPDGEAVEMNNRYPVTLVSAELPEFLKSTSGDASLVPAGEPVVATTSVSVQVDGFFYRLWSYESDLMKARGGKQFAPLIVAGRLLDRRPQSSDPIGVSMIGWIAAGGVLLAIAATLLFTWFTRRGDRKARRQRMSGELEES